MSYSTRIKVFHVLTHVLSLASIVLTSVAIGWQSFVTGYVYTYDGWGNSTQSFVSFGLFNSCWSGSCDGDALSWTDYIDDGVSGFAALFHSLQAFLVAELALRILGGHSMTYRTNMEANHPKKTAWLIHSTNLLTVISGVIAVTLVATTPSILMSKTSGYFSYDVSSYLQISSFPTGTLGLIFYAFARYYINKAAKKDNPTTDMTPLLAGHQVALTVNGQTYMASIAPADQQPYVHNQPGMYQSSNQVINQPTMVMEGQPMTYQPVGGYVVHQSMAPQFTQQYTQMQYPGQMHAINF